MASYAEKQLFKTRFWKHVWELDPESLRELLEAGNPIGHVNFGFRVPSDHGYPFAPGYKGKIYEVSNTKDKSTSEFRNEAIENYLSSHGKSACDILWKMYSKVEDTGEIYLPNGANILGLSEILDIVVLLAEHGAELYSRRPSIKWPGTISVQISDMSLLLMANCELPYKKILNLARGSLADRRYIPGEYYELMLLCYPESFNRFVNWKRPKTDVFKYLFSWCQESDDVTKRLWKLRLVNIDPERWIPKYDDYKDVSVDGLDDVSVEELQAMYEGHPNNINVHEVELALSDRPAKKAKPGTQ